MPCNFKKGDIVLVNDSAEDAFAYIGQKATVLEAFTMGVGWNAPGGYNGYRNACVLKLQFEDGTIIEHVPESHVSPLE